MKSLMPNTVDEFLRCFNSNKFCNEKLYKDNDLRFKDFSYERKWQYDNLFKDEGCKMTHIQPGLLYLINEKQSTRKFHISTKNTAPSYPVIIFGRIISNINDIDVIEKATSASIKYCRNTLD